MKSSCFWNLTSVDSFFSKARTEFTPRAYPSVSSLRSIMPPEMQANLPMEREAKAVYEPPDVYNPTLHPPPGEVDVLSIVEGGLDFEAVNDPVYEDFYDPVTNHSPLSQVPAKGLGWTTWKANVDQCDGSVDSWCGRGRDDNCLLYGHNDGRNGFQFDGYSGWIMLTIPKVKLGYIVLKYESWHPPTPKTEGWTSVNNEASGRRLEEHETESTDFDTAEDRYQQAHRGLKYQVKDYCEDFRFEYSIDGKVTSLNLEEYKKRNSNPQRVVELFLLSSDPGLTGGQEKDIELGFRVLGCGRDRTLSLNHVYWA